MRTRSFPARRSLLLVVALALAAVVAVTLPASAGASRRAVLPKPGQGGKLVFAGLSARACGIRSTRPQAPISPPSRSSTPA